MGYMAGENGSGLLLIHSYPRSTEDSFSAEFEALGVGACLNNFMCFLGETTWPRKAKVRATSCAAENARCCVEKELVSPHLK